MIKIKILIDILWVVTSMSLYLIFFKVSNNTINFLDGNFDFWGQSVPKDWVLILMLIIITYPLLFVYTSFTKGNDTLDVKIIKIAEPLYIPVYIGYFVIATSISNVTTFYIISAMLILLIWKTNFYFNPILFLFGYNFYEIEDEKETNMLLISKKTKLKRVPKV